MAGTVDSPAAALEAGVTEPGIAVEMTGPRLSSSSPTTVV